MTETNESDKQISQQYDSQHLTVNECQALQYLHADGWSIGEICMAFGVADGEIHNHIEGRCSHPDVDDPVVADPPVGEDLKIARRTRGLTQQELADLVGVSAPFIGKMERGKKSPSPLTARKLEEALSEVEKHAQFK